MFSVVGSFSPFVGLLLNGPDDKDDYEIKILEWSHGFVFPEVDNLATAKKSDM